MVYPEVAIHPRIRHFEGRPSRERQLHSGEVEGDNIVCIVLEFTINIPGDQLSSSVEFVDMSHLGHFIEAFLGL